MPASDESAWRAAIERVRKRGPGFYAGSSEMDGWDRACDALESELEELFVLPVVPVQSPDPPAPASRWKHVERGTTYTVLGIGRLQVAGPLDNVQVVVYQQTGDGTAYLWIRPVFEFMDGRFVEDR